MTEETKKELEKLEKQLLENEEWFRRELDSAKRMIGQVPNAPRAAAPAAVKPYPAAVPAKPAEKVQKEMAPRKKGGKGLLILLMVELLGIGGLAAYWLLYLMR